MSIDLSDELVDLLRGGAICYFATTMPDGSPQLTQTWVDTDGQHILINTVVGYQKAKNIAHDPRVALTVSDPAHPSRYHEIRGRVINTTEEGATSHIEALAQRYLGGPYPWYGGHDQRRLIVTVSPGHINTMG